MSGFQALLQEVYSKNKRDNEDLSLNFPQEITQGTAPETVLMIDQVHRKSLSPLMEQLYRFAIEWKNAIFGTHILNPNSLSDVYEQDGIKETIRLIAENYLPTPPCDPSDWQRTALLAIDEWAEALCFYWWQAESDLEPCVIYISGGSVKIFHDLKELMEYLAHGTFPERGDQIYAELEKERGTLRD